ncbi:hypothetical protein [Bradyrhizobium canariense]|uniref:hypothetical protein n=1 Tax=Bradyrhizobium canariense TaxID=255045 RepID=UPI0011BAB756|nr:hypothetical protein [Bradyrhizobium canariense]
MSSGKYVRIKRMSIGTLILDPANHKERRPAYFAYLGLLTIQDGDDATILDAAGADGASDVDPLP